jgi:hypothetical protein
MGTNLKLDIVALALSQHGKGGMSFVLPLPYHTRKV